MLRNTSTSYGSVARSFHWIIAALILIDLALGKVGDFTPRSAENIAFLQTLYSTHKTIGIVVLFLAVLRVAWAFSQPRPVPLHPSRRVETLAAETAHWLLYLAIFILPLSGWIMHAAEDGFAPIWWPFGQNLPFVPKSDDLAHWVAGVHSIASTVLIVVVLAHIFGALKHAVIDRDTTLSRMVRGTPSGDPDHTHSNRLAAPMAVGVWALAIGAALILNAPSGDTTAMASEAPVASGWAVQDGSVTITVTQMGAEVDGRFANWTSAIDYDAATGSGTVTTTIDTTSLTLGSVTDQAKGPEFFDVENHANAVFEAAITRTSGDAHVAEGTLTLVGETVPVTLDFTLSISDGVATMSGTTTLDRRDFSMGEEYPDESNVGFGVSVSIALTATQVE